MYGIRCFMPIWVYKDVYSKLVLAKLKKNPIHVVKQNLIFPILLLIFVGVIILGFFGLTYNVDKVPVGIKLIFVIIPSLVLISHLLQRIFFYWELVFYDNSVEIKRPYRPIKNDNIKIRLVDIEEAGFLQGFRVHTSLYINLKSGKKYKALLDKNLREISKVLIFLENSDVKIGLYCDDRIKQKLKKIGLKTTRYN